MKIIAAVPIGRNGRQYKAGDLLDVSPRDANLYVLSKQAKWPQHEAKPVPDAAAPQAEQEKPRRGRYRRRDMKAEGDGE